MAKKKKPTIRVRLVRSPIGRIPAQRKTVRALGLGRIGSMNEIEASDAVRGMVASVAHLVESEEI
jgi:large subunit ribosomal protein L30